MAKLPSTAHYHLESYRAEMYYSGRPSGRFVTCYRIVETATGKGIIGGEGKASMARTMTRMEIVGGWDNLPEVLEAKYRDVKRADEMRDLIAAHLPDYTGGGRQPKEAQV
jgi:hypothetical protein